MISNAFLFITLLRFSDIEFIYAEALGLKQAQDRLRESKEQ